MQYNKQLVRPGFRLALILTVGIAFLIGLTASSNAQTGTSSGSTDTRARRAPETNGTASSNKTDGDTSDLKDIASNPQPSKPVKAVTPVAVSSTDDQVKPDRVTLLRSQILDAKTEMERVRLQRTLVDYLIALGRSNEAVVELHSMLAAENLDAASYYNIGNGLARLGDLEQAIVAYRKAVDARQGNYPRALNNLGVVLLSLDRLDEAFDAFVQAIKQQNFRYPEASYNLGILYAKRGEADLAISEWTRALTLQPNHVEAAVGLARAYAVTGRPERGLEVIATTLKRTGPNVELEATRDQIVSKGLSK